MRLILTARVTRDGQQLRVFDDEVDERHERRSRTTLG
jgi:hypothetical protein